MMKTIAFFILLFAVSSVQCQSKLNDSKSEQFNNKHQNSHENLQKNDHKLVYQIDCKEICLEFPKIIHQDTLKLQRPIQFTFTNHTQEMVVAGTRYILEKRTKKQWSNVPLDGIFNDIGFLIPSGKKNTFEIPSYFLRNLSLGKYRITQTVFNMQDKKQFSFANEFSVIK